MDFQDIVKVPFCGQDGFHIFSSYCAYTDWGFYSYIYLPKIVSGIYIFKGRAVFCLPCQSIFQVCNNLSIWIHNRVLQSLYWVVDSIVLQFWNEGCSEYIWLCFPIQVLFVTIDGQKYKFFPGCTTVQFLGHIESKVQEQDTGVVNRIWNSG